jgi:hypothetical protein
MKKKEKKKRKKNCLLPKPGALGESNPGPIRQDYRLRVTVTPRTLQLSELMETDVFC